MAHAFNVISAKPTFGTIKENLSQSDYINRKKGLNTYCNSPLRNCPINRVSTSYNKINSFNLGFHISSNKCNININLSNLVSGQYTKLNLHKVCSIAAGSPPTQSCSSSLPCNPCQNNNPILVDPNNSTVPFYYDYTIDPLGELFGRSQCGELNYANYRVLKI
jgi:hypothetical protein